MTASRGNIAAAIEPDGMSVAAVLSRLEAIDAEYDRDCTALIDQQLGPSEYYERKLELRERVKAQTIELARALGGDSDCIGKAQLTIAKHVGAKLSKRAEALAGVEIDAVHAQAAKAHAESVVDSVQYRTWSDCANTHLRTLYDEHQELRGAAQYREAIAQARRTRTFTAPDGQQRTVDDMLAQAEQAANSATRARQAASARAELKALSIGYLQALAEVRPMGGAGVYHERSTKAAKAAFDEALECFPSDWVQASNASRSGLIAKITRSRAHYSHANVEKVKKKFDDIDCFVHDPGSRTAHRPITRSTPTTRPQG